MAEVGLLHEDSRVELIDGEIIEMAPIGSEHAGHNNHLLSLLAYHLHGKAIVAGQNPVILGGYEEPQPDIALLRWRNDYYRTAHPHAEDILLIIEISDSTLRYDHDVKIPLYAKTVSLKFGYWISRIDNWKSTVSRSMVSTNSEIAAAPARSRPFSALMLSSTWPNYFPIPERNF